MLFRKKSDEYNHWVSEIKKSRNYRRPTETNWRRWYNIADDQMWLTGKLADGSEPIQVNVLQSILQNIIPSVNFKEGECECRAINMEDVARAAIYEKIGRFVTRSCHLADEFLWIVFDALVLGNGLAKIGFHTLPLLAEPQWNAGIASEKTARPDSVYGMYWPLFEYLPDYTAPLWNRQRWFIHELDKHIDELKSNDMYNQVQVKKIKPNRRADDIFYINDDKMDKKKDYVAVQEVHDLINGEMMVMAEGAGATDYLYKGAEPFGMIPVENLVFFPRPMKLWGKGITQSIERHIRELSKAHIYMQNYLKKESLIKILVDSARFDRKAKSQLQSSSDSIISLAGNPGGSYEVIDYSGASKSFVFEQAMQIKKNEIREMAGSGRQQQGLHEVGVRTATESKVLQANADTVNRWRSERFSSFASRILEKMIYIVSVTYPPERIAQMVGTQPLVVQALIEPYNPLKYELSYGNAAIMDRQERMEKFMTFVQLFGQALNPAVVLQVASDVFDLEYTDLALIPGAQMGQSRPPNQSGQQASAGYRPPESQEV